MKRSRKTLRPRASTALPSSSNSMMSSAVTRAGASERDIRKMLWVRRIARADMAESVEHAEIRENPAADHDVLDQVRRHRVHRVRPLRPRRRTGQAKPEDKGGEDATEHRHVLAFH